MTTTPTTPGVGSNVANANWVVQNNLKVSFRLHAQPGVVHVRPVGRSAVPIQPVSRVSFTEWAGLLITTAAPILLLRSDHLP